MTAGTAHQSQGKYLDMMNLPQFAAYENKLSDFLGQPGGDFRLASWDPAPTGNGLFSAMRPNIATACLSGASINRLLRFCRIFQPGRNKVISSKFIATPSMQASIPRLKTGSRRSVRACRPIRTRRMCRWATTTDSSITRSCGARCAGLRARRHATGPVVVNGQVQEG